MFGVTNGRTLLAIVCLYACFGMVPAEDQVKADEVPGGDEVIVGGVPQGPTVTLSGVSWIFRGTAQQNNTQLTFNMYDTLNLICRANGLALGDQLIFIVSKGTIPTDATFDSTSGALSVTNMGTLIFSDVDDLQPGFENFVIFGGASVSTVAAYQMYQFRHVNVGLLRTEDADIYHCSVYYYETCAPVFMTSGGLTILVNTRLGQAHSTRSRVNSYLAYSTVILSASKVLF